MDIRCQPEVNRDEGAMSCFLECGVLKVVVRRREIDVDDYGSGHWLFIFDGRKEAIIPNGTHSIVVEAWVERLEDAHILRHAVCIDDESDFADPADLRPALRGRVPRIDGVDENGRAHTISKVIGPRHLADDLIFRSFQRRKHGFLGWILGLHDLLARLRPEELPGRDLAIFILQWPNAGFEFELQRDRNDNRLTVKSSRLKSILAYNDQCGKV